MNAPSCPYPSEAPWFYDEPGPLAAAVTALETLRAELSEARRERDYYKQQTDDYAAQNCKD